VAAARVDRLPVGADHDRRHAHAADADPDRVQLRVDALLDLLGDRAGGGIDADRLRHARREGAPEQLLDALHGEDVEQHEERDGDVGDAERGDPVERDAARGAALGGSAFPSDGTFSPSVAQHSLVAALRVALGPGRILTSGGSPICVPGAGRTILAVAKSARVLGREGIVQSERRRSPRKAFDGWVELHVDGARRLASGFDLSRGGIGLVLGAVGLGRASSLTCEFALPGISCRWS